MLVSLAFLALPFSLTAQRRWTVGFTRRAVAGKSLSLENYPRVLPPTARTQAAAGESDVGRLILYTLDNFDIASKPFIDQCL
jgi:hypothetical protein